MSELTVIKMSEVQAGLCRDAMSGDSGEVLIDIITDQIVLADRISAEEAKGAGKVLKFLRSLHDDSANIIRPTKTES